MSFSRPVSRPSPAMIVACIALAVSLGGNAIAAGVLIRNTNQIRNGAVTGPDVRNSTLSAIDVRNRSLGIADLSPSARASLRGQRGTTGAAGTAGAAGAPGAQGPPGPIAGTPAGGALSGTFPNPALANGAVTEPAIATGAVTINKIASGAVNTVKLAADSVTNAKIATGAVTKDGLGDGAVGRAELSAIYVQTQGILTFGTDIPNNDCTVYSTTFVSDAPVGSQTLVLEVVSPSGWSAEGTTTTNNNSMRVRVCNKTGATADPPATFVITALVLRP